MSVDGTQQTYVFAYDRSREYRYRHARRIATAATGITIEGAGTDIWNETDDGHHYFTDVRGDFDATNVTSIEDTDGWAKAGLLFRESLAADARNVMVWTTPGNDASFSWRANTDSYTASTVSNGGVVIRNGCSR